MSALLGLFGGGGARTTDDVQGMLRAMRSRGLECIESWSDENALLVVGRYEWETDPDFSGATAIADDGRFVVAADASIYHRAALLRSLDLEGIRPNGQSSADLILAAYRAWGDGCTDHLDGDYAFVVWDRQLRRCTCVRDFAGKRPLHYAALGNEFVVASTIGAVAAHPRCPPDLNVPVIAATSAGLILSAGPETAYRAINVLPNACRLTWSSRGAGAPVRFWNPPVGQSGSPLSHDEAAEELRELLVDAARERMPRTGPSSVWMSGGWDSTAVFASAQVVAQREGRPKPVPISISYPQGDPGREDELIAAVAGHWSTDVHWLDIGSIAFLDREEERAAGRDEPYRHLYENWNAALAAGSRASGSRVALDGNGGDQLFQNSDVFLADLFRQGKWLTVAREWPTRPRGGYREMFATVIQPNLGPFLLKAASWARGGRPLHHYLERKIPPWIRGNFVTENELAERDLEFLTRPVSPSRAEREIDWYFTCLFVSRAFAILSSLALESGVELRSPLSDRRVIELALSRPWWERSSGTETKRLLRSSMRGLLPDSVLAPRTHRTGITSGYSHGAMTKVFPRLLEQVRRTPLLLEELGVVDSRTFYEAATSYAERGGSSFIRVNLFYTLQTELWLRARMEKSEMRQPDLNVPALLAG